MMIALVMLLLSINAQTLVHSYNIQDLQDVCGILSDSTGIRSATCQSSISAADSPWQVSILGRDGVHWCSGTLITDRHVLSSAHCFFHESCGSKCKIKSVALYELHFGRSNRTDIINSKTKQRSSIPDDVDVVRSIADIFVPPGFEQRDVVIGGSDIAIVLIDEPIQFRREILPACLPSLQTKDIFDVGGVGYIAGFSHIRSGNEVPLNLQAFRMDIIRPSSCIKNLLIFGYDSEDAKDTICSKSTFRCAQSKESSICKGDAGGPLMSPFRKPGGLSQWVVGGVHAFGAKLCGKSRENIPIFYTRVHDHLDFIERIINIDTAATTPLTTPSVTSTTKAANIFFTRKPVTSTTTTPTTTTTTATTTSSSPFPLPRLGQASFKCTDSKDGYICKYLNNGGNANQIDNNLVCGNTREGYSCIFKIPKPSQVQSRRKPFNPPRFKPRNRPPPSSPTTTLSLPKPPLRRNPINTQVQSRRKPFNLPRFKPRNRPTPPPPSSSTTTLSLPKPPLRRNPINTQRAPKLIRPVQRKKIRIQGTYRLKNDK